MTISEFRAAVGYSEEWDQFLDSRFYQQQLSHYLTSGPQDYEHYKWAGYLYITEQFDFTQQAVWQKLVALIENDINEHLFKGAISALIEKEVLTRDMLAGCGSDKILQFKKVQALLASE